ncbi:MAG: deoxyribose-phosphate aldolase [Clostridia bacterium]
MFFKKKPEQQSPDRLIKNIESIVDFTLLIPTATYKDIEKLCNIAYKNKYYSVCVNPVNVQFAKKYIDENFDGAVKICSVVGFPLGENTIETKVFEMKQALCDGASEIDVVACISRIKMGDYDYLKKELSRLVRSCKKAVIKVIIETCYLNRDEIAKVSRVCAKCKVDYVKTSTGFGTAGASPEDVELISNSVDNKCGVKASGGIKTKEDAIILVRAGATRIGTSREI